jgi:hypothetical protein
MPQFLRVLMANLSQRRKSSRGDGLFDICLGGGDAPADSYLLAQNDSNLTNLKEEKLKTTTIGIFSITWGNSTANSKTYRADLAGRAP